MSQEQWYGVFSEGIMVAAFPSQATGEHFARWHFAASAPWVVQPIGPISHYEALSHRARYVFTRYYFHELRDDKSREDSANLAMTKVKDETLRRLEEDLSLDQLGKEERWAMILTDLIDWQRLLVLVPVDLDQLKKDMDSGKRVASAILVEP